MIGSRALNTCFDALEMAAIVGLRAPMNGTKECPHGAARKLAKQGRIRIEISGRNWRTITILTGPHAGKSTLPNPQPGHAVWKIIDARGTRINGEKPRARQPQWPAKASPWIG